MTITADDLTRAGMRMQLVRDAGHAVSARYDRVRQQLVIGLNTGVHLLVPVRLLEGLATAAAADLAEITISPSGLGLHWPRLDADLYVPALLQGSFGSKRWMDAECVATDDARRIRSEDPRKQIAEFRG